MNIVCCVKQVPDPETPASQLKVDPVANKVIHSPGVALVMSPFDEQAVEVALRIKDRHGGKVTVLSMGPPSVRDVVKHGIAMGADDGIVLTDSAFDDAGPSVSAYLLAQAIKKIGDYDIIFCGRQAADFDNGQVGLGIAELLGLSVLINGRGAEVMDGKVRFERVLPDGVAIYEASPPVVLTFSQEVGQPRYPTLRNIMTAARKELTVWNAQDIGVDSSRLGKAGSRTRLLRLYLPVYGGQCEIIEGGTLAEAGQKLALKLREAKVI